MSTNLKLNKLFIELESIQETSEGLLRGGFAVMGGETDVTPLDYNGNCGENCNCGKNCGCTNANCGKNCNCDPTSPTSEKSGVIPGFTLPF